MRIHVVLTIVPALLVLPAIAEGAPAVIDVSVGRDGVCAITADGSVACWGGSRAFDVDDQISKAPHRMGALKAKSVAVGGDHVCAVDKEGVVQCAGQSEVTAIARGAAQNLPDDSPDPGAVTWRKIPGVPKAVRVVSGPFHACALTESKDVVCWGETSENRTGGEKREPHVVPGLGQVTRLSASEDLTCALSADKKVRCFGALSLGETNEAAKKTLTLPAPPAIDVAVGASFVCTLGEDGLTATCLGMSERAGGKDDGTPVTLKLPEKAHRLVGGSPSLCAETDSGKLACAGELAALLSRSGAIEPTQWQSYETPGKGFSMYWYDVCGVSNAGELMCAGSLDHAAHELPREARSAVEVAGLGDVKELSAGQAHVCAKKGDGSVWCWGGTYQDGAVAQRIHELSGLASLTSGGGRTCGEVGAGPLRCWSPPDWMNHMPDPLGGPPVDKPRGLALGESHACVVQADGHVSCWGGDYWGALGTRSDPEHTKVVREAQLVQGLSGATAISAGWNSTCALLDSGAVRCWGANEKGQLGQGTEGPSGGVGDVVGVAHAKKIAVGQSVACALESDGRASCWGADALTPVPWPGSDVLDIAAGAGSRSRACVVRATGKVECGLPGSSRVIRGVDDAKAVVAGEDFGCALVGGGAVRCWGKRDRGQLGDGRPPISTKLEIVALPTD